MEEGSQKVIKVRLLESSQVAPVLPHYHASPSTSTNNKASYHEFPLTFLDLPLILHCSPEPLLFYTLPNIHINHFFHSILPQIKHSLSLTLRRFYPLAGTLSWSPQLNQPVIRYVNGDSITLTVAESNADFTHLCGYHARHAKDFQHLIPPLLLTPDHHTTNFKDVPVFAAQVTLFPNSGICLGVTFLHAMMDGRAMAFFLKSWAWTSRFGYSPHKESLLPFFDSSTRASTQKHSLQMFLQFMQSKSMPPEQDCANWLMLTSKVPITNQVFATFELKGVDIDMLKRWVLYKTNNNINGELLQAPSRFELACAYVWVCLAEATNNSSSTATTTSSIVFVADYRSRLDPPVPKTYVGNCILSVRASARRCDIVGDNGIVVAVESIRKEIRELGVEFVRSFEARISRSLLNNRYHNDVVEGSTQFDLYKLDFGWGKPKKFELASIVKSRTIFFADSGKADDDDDSVMEISLARGEDEINAFSSNFVKGLENLRKKKCCLCAL